jgi:glycolate oxidase FAD binding subunit
LLDFRMSDAAFSAVKEAIRAAAAAQQPVAIRGGGTKAFYGESVDGDVLDTSPLAGIVAYEPTELVITALAGTPLDTIETTMRTHGQLLGFEPPHFARGGTLGGAIASGLSGPRRPYAGAARDFVLGMRVIDGTGEALNFGGRVMKNVAGFDVSRLMTGALGTLGVITEVSLKCLPLPRAEATREIECSAAESIRLMNAWGGRPLPLSASCWHAGRLSVRLSGAASAIAAAVEAIGGSESAHADAFWSSVRDHTHPFFAPALRDGHALWRLSVRSTAPVESFGGDPPLIEWGGSLRWLVTAADADAAPMRGWAAAQGGHATLFRGHKRGGAFAPRDATILGLHRRLKATFDPHGILNRGRLYPEF